MTTNTTGSRSLSQILNGELVDNSDMAIELAEVLVRQRFGDDCLKQQRPLSAREAGEHWIIEGAPNASDEATGVGPVHIEMKKADAGIASLCFELCSELKAKLHERNRPSK